MFKYFKIPGSLESSRIIPKSFKDHPKIVEDDPKIDKESRTLSESQKRFGDFLRTCALPE